VTHASEQVGRAARKRAPRSAHAQWEAEPGRADPIATLERQAETRTPELVPVRYGRMARSPLAFLRGAAAIMAADLAATAVTGLGAQLCGDGHLANFGAFAAPDRSLVFDLNDFDETLPGPWEWDVKRLAASLVVAARDRGFDRAKQRDIVLSGVRAYREAMRAFAAMRTIDVWYARLDVDRQVAEWGRHLDPDRRTKLDRAVAKARRKNSLRAMSKLTYEVDGGPRIVSDPPLIVPIGELLGAAEAEPDLAWLEALLRDYRRSLPVDVRELAASYQPVDLAHKVVGVGSVGMRTWIVLLLGRDDTDPLFLQVKEAQPSVLEPFARPSSVRNEGQRVVRGQRLMQAAGDILVGWLRVKQDVGDGRPRDYYVRQLWDAKASVAIDLLSASELSAYAKTCGWTLARAHARSADRVAIGAYLGASDNFDRAVAAFAEIYADQTERDHEALVTAIRAGRIAADPDR
jgi:uncharacterized protein (DUF2252 family)